MKEKIVSVEGVNWGASVVLLDKTEDVFVKRHMDDVGTYKDMEKDKKIATLKLVWKLSSQAATVPAST